MITIKIDDRLEKMLRKKAARPRGAVRGSISKSIEEALRMWLGLPEESAPEQRLFVALKGGRELTQASSLRGLSEKLRRLGVDPRDAVIKFVPEGPAVHRLGFRLKPPGKAHVGLPG